MNELDRDKLKRLTDEYAHVYSLVGDETMPRKHKELHNAIDDITQQYFDLECRAVGRMAVIEVRDARIAELEGVLAMQAEALKDIARGPLQEPQPFEQYAKRVADAVISATSEPVSAWTQEVEQRGAVKALEKAALIVENTELADPSGLSRTEQLRIYDILQKTADNIRATSKKAG